ncbi:MAG TPA: DegT/DnrJ/EryC1/StrS family aminotransferase [Candidatus Paceibacterota bacterium]|nr:DegT/DnrJ/EryC1/StrS family aminotransferase [Candidatus Paceibacterota bacterium]
MEYKVRFVNPQKQYADHRDEFLKAFDETLSRGAIVNREELWKFEEDFAKFCGAKYAVGVNSGTSALDLAFQAAGIGPNDEVITVAHTFIASISTIQLAGAKPVLIDVGPDFNMDPSLIEKALTPRTKAIEPVHLNGRLCDMEAVMEIAKRKGLIVIEDAAQALGATMKMANGNVKKAGTFGIVGCFSLYWAKALGGWGNNGIAITDDEEIARKLKLMRYNGEDRESRKFYYHGHNFLMDNVHAALLSVKLKYFPGWLQRRKEIAERYKNGLTGLKEIKTPHWSDERFGDTYTNYVIRAERRDELKNYLTQQGVETMISWATPMYQEPLFEKEKPRLVDARGDVLELQETEKICKEVISLPMYPELTDKQIDYVTETIKSFYY